MSLGVSIMIIHEQRIREFAYQIWESEGKPQGHSGRHWEIAFKLATRSHSDSDIQPMAANEPVEPISPGQPAHPTPNTQPIQPDEPSQPPAQPVDPINPSQPEPPFTPVAAVSPPRKAYQKAVRNVPAKSLIDTKPMVVAIAVPVQATKINRAQKPTSTKNESA
jgi:hypothetical protein